MRTIRDFITDNKLTMTHLPERHLTRWDGGPYEYQCLIANERGESITVPFSKGLGLIEKKTRKGWERATFCQPKTMHDAAVFKSKHRPEPPRLEEVLECMRLDSMALSSCFEDWAEEYGYDTDSREAERIHGLCVRQARDLRDLLGMRAFNDLLNCEEE